MQKSWSLRFVPTTLMGIMVSTGVNTGLPTLFQPTAVGTFAHAAVIAPTPTVLSPLVSSQPELSQTAEKATATTPDPHIWRNGTIESMVPPAPPSAPTRPGRRPGEASRQPSQRDNPTPAIRSTLTPGPATERQDPAEQIAPAVIDLAPNPRFLNPVVSQAMEGQLRNLIGRFESALLMANSLDAPTTLALDRAGVTLTAADKEHLEALPARDLPPVLAAAQQLLDEWDALIIQGEHTEAQERWLQVRHNLWEQMPAERPYAQAEIRAVWLDRGTIVAARSAAGLETLFDQLAAAGINTVFFETVNAGYPIYPSQVAPQQNPLTRSWDPLEAAVDLAHQRGMTLHAWVWVFAAGNQRHNRILNLPDQYLGPVLAQNPTWAGADNQGNPIPRGQDKPFLDPANPEVRRYLVQLMSEIVTEYKVDGLHLDYIRYPFQDPAANRTYGYGEVARWQFRSISGIDPLELMPRPEADTPANQQAQQRMLWDRWTEFRIQQVNSFVENVSQTLRRQRPELILSAAVFAKPEYERLQKIQQDWGTWAREGYVDWIVLMSYAEDTSRFEQLVVPWLVAEDFGSALIIPGVRMLDLSRPEIVDQLQVTRDLPTPGYALFATADLQADLTTFLQQTQGVTPTQDQSPFQMAFDRYQSLQREWSWLLSQQKLWMERETLTTWVADVNQLEEDLLALAAAPSHRSLSTVEQRLTQVQHPLGGTILIDTVNGNYRVQAWQHRLTAIERLLRYGEQTDL